MDQGTGRGHGQVGLVLMLHGVGSAPSQAEDNEVYHWVDRAVFEALLDNVVQASADRDLPPVHLTFDDGFASDAEVVLPALVERGLTAEFFICAGRIGQSGFLDEQGVAALLAAGMGVGSHGWSHVNWRKADDATLGVEVRGAKERISDVIGSEVRAVAIPFGSYDRRVLRAIRAAGFTSVNTSDPGHADGGWLVRRESWRHDWHPDRLGDLVREHPGLRVRARRSLARAVKQWR